MKTRLEETNHMRKLMGLKPIVEKVITERFDTGLTPEEQNAVDQGTNKDPEGYTVVAPPGKKEWCQRQVSSDWFNKKLMAGTAYLKKYDCGDAVGIAQGYINDYEGSDVLKVDKAYGDDTIKEVKRVQGELDTKVDGYYGKDTHDALIKVMSEPEVEPEVEPVVEPEETPKEKRKKERQSRRAARKLGRGSRKLGKSLEKTKRVKARYDLK